MIYGKKTVNDWTAKYIAQYELKNSCTVAPEKHVRVLKSVWFEFDHTQRVKEYTTEKKAELDVKYNTERYCSTYIRNS